MQLRTPQARSLTLFADYLESDAGKRLIGSLRKSERLPKDELEAEARSYFATIPESSKFRGFDERAFPAFAFALATGVGKTRLMGAFVTYLFLVYQIQHFLIVAPGNTIYRKLVDDFSKMNSPKYVFRGLEEINSFTANVITKDNYMNSPSHTQTSLTGGNKIQINLFNIQQFAEKDKRDKNEGLEGKGINAGSEIIGMENDGKGGYFHYLSTLDDLVVLLDESHHYHAEAAFVSLDRMNPLMGLEFTATPYTGNFVGRGKDRVPEQKQSIVYDYNLGNAIRDGYVKDPWIGTEADVDFKQFETDSIDTDLRKMSLGIYFHERAKAAIALYATDQWVRAIKPVILVVAKDTTHASELKAAIDSDEFRGGHYRGKVIEIHTKTKGAEADENIEKLISLESPENIVEIVIHVNMLKEGWDVANIYTIVPLRQSASEILTEQTIGRGLRLPYGERVSYFDTETNARRYELVDRVMIVAHEKYSQVVEQARNSTLIQPMNIEQVSSQDTAKERVVVEARPVAMERMDSDLRASEPIMASIIARAESIIGALKLPEMTPETHALFLETKKTEIFTEISRIQIEGIACESYHVEYIPREVPLAFDEWSIFKGFSESALQDLENIRLQARKTFEQRHIPIPRLILSPKMENITITPFELDTSVLPRLITETVILEEALQARPIENLFGNEVLGGRESTFTRIRIRKWFSWNSWKYDYCPTTGSITARLWWTKTSSHVTCSKSSKILSMICIWWFCIKGNDWNKCQKYRRSNI
jgi:type III restriction enzyme